MNRDREQTMNTTECSYSLIQHIWSTLMVFQALCWALEIHLNQTDNTPALIHICYWLRWQRICLQCRRPRFDPWVGKIPWGREQLPLLQYSGLENSTDRGAWQATGHGVAKSWTQLSNFHFHHFTDEETGALVWGLRSQGKHGSGFKTKQSDSRGCALSYYVYCLSTVNKNQRVKLIGKFWKGMNQLEEELSVWG